MTRKRKNRKGLYLLLFLLIVGSSAAYYQFKNKKVKPEKVAVEKAQKRTIIETVYSSGKLFPATELEITSNVSGTIIELFVKAGDLVKKGQILAKVDPEALVSIVERAEAATEGSKAQLEAVKAQKKQLEAQFDNTKIIFERNKKLYEEGIVSKAEYQAAEASYNTSKANIEAAIQNILAAEFTVKSSEATVKEQKKNLSQTRIYAPIAGVVSTLYKKQGEQVVGTAQMAGTPILKIANLKTVEIRVDVNERDILNTIIGDSAEIELDAYPDRKFLGIVTQIANTSSGLNSLSAQLTSDQVTNFEVRILMVPDSYQDLDVQSERSPFRAGLSASAEIRTNTAPNILSVTVASVTAREDQANLAVPGEDKELKEYVFIQQGDTVEMRQVITGIQNDNYIEIISGVQAGERIVKAPYDAISKLLNNGSKVEVVQEKELYKITKNY
jgi:HlyD family secretion protein